MKASRAFFDEKNIDTTLKDISLGKNIPKIAFVSILLLYVFVSVFVARFAHSNTSIILFGNALPLAIFTGSFSSLANICIIFLVVLFKRSGFLTALVLLLVQFPLLANSLFVQHGIASIPGSFTNLFTILAITIIYKNNCRIEKYQEKMRDHAVTDLLTGLPNHFACTELMKDFIRRGEKFAIVSIDLNSFKRVNDLLGHEGGNKLIKEIASRWKLLADSRVTGTVDFLSRLGGDEFSLVIRGYESDEDIIKTINYYDRELERKITVDGVDCFLTSRYGYAVYPDDDISCEVLFSCADSALHELQRQHSSSKILRFSPEILKAEDVLAVERKIRTAIDNDSVLYYLQPQFDVEHNLRGFEALARLKDGDGSFISPATFIPVAERCGLVDRIDMQVFKKSAKFLSEILKTKEMDITICINISVRHLMKNDFMDEIKDIISESGVSASHFEVEITESIMIDSTEKALQCINEMKKLGMKVAIDDFGTGYSSLSYLSKLPADILKIDKSFIDIMNSSDSSKQYVAAIISIGHLFKLDVISEGVETSEQLKTLKEIGCDYIQGFFWGKPLPPDDAKKLIFN